jgi:GntR family transcriptional regulator
MLLLQLDRHSGTPVYRQIVDQVRFQVASGVLAAGTELPSTRAVAAEHGVNPMTVSKAYGELEHEGVLERRPGLPHVVADRAPEASAQDRASELARALAPAVQAARQLGVDPREAVRTFERLLAEEVPVQRSTPRESTR